MPKQRSKLSNINLQFQSKTLTIIGETGFFNAMLRVNSLLGINRTPRVTYKGLKKMYKSFPTLVELVEALGFSNTDYLRLAKLHDKRNNGRYAAYGLLGIPLVILLVMIPMFLLIDSLTGTLSFLLVLSVLPWEFAIIKGVFLFLDKFYADTLCIYALLGVLVELSANDVLENPIRRRILLTYIQDLARYTLLLPICFSNDLGIDKTTIQKHFRTMEQFVREKARCAILPKEATLNDLRRDFLMLAHLYITGNYGLFSSQEAESTAVDVPEKSLPWYRQLIIGVIRIIGIVIPLAALYFLISQPSLFASLAIDPSILTFVAIAWLMISIDTAFSLGVTSKVVSLAKEIKDLT